MEYMYTFLLIVLPVLIFSKTICVVDYESFNKVKLSYEFNLSRYSISSNGNVVNFTQWNFIIDECNASYSNLFCKRWHPKEEFDICRLIRVNVVECTPLYIEKEAVARERNFRFVGKFNGTPFIILHEQYTFRSRKCYCREGFEFNPHLSIMTDAINGKMQVRMKPYDETSNIYLQSKNAYVTQYLAGSLRVTKRTKRTFDFDNDGFHHFEIVDMDICSMYNVTVKLKTSDCTNREMVPSNVQFNLSATNMSNFFKSLSCWHNRTSVLVDGIDQKIDLQKFFFKVSTSVTSFNITGNGTFSISNMHFKENTSFSISLCSKGCNLCSKNYTIKCHSQIVSQTKIRNENNGTGIYIAVGVVVPVILVISWLMFLRNKWKCLKIVTRFINSLCCKSHPSENVQPRLDESTETAIKIKPRNLEGENIYETIPEVSHYNNDEIDISQKEERSEEINRRLSTVIHNEAQLSSTSSVESIGFELNFLALGNNNGNIPTIFQQNSIMV